MFPEDRAEELREVAQGRGFHCHACIQLRATPEHEVIRSLWSWGLQPAEELKQVCGGRRGDWTRRVVPQARSDAGPVCFPLTFTKKISSQALGEDGRLGRATNLGRLPLRRRPRNL